MVVSPPVREIFAVAIKYIFAKNVAQTAVVMKIGYFLLNIRETDYPLFIQSLV
jgi:hypothetical protein